MTLLDEKRSEARLAWREGGAVALVAAGAAGAVWAMGTGVAGVELVVRSGSGTREIGLASAVVTALVVALAAGGLLRVLERRARRGRAIWTGVAGAVLAMSLAGPLSALSLPAGLWLAALHVVVASVVVGGLRVRHPGVA